MIRSEPPTTPRDDQHAESGRKHMVRIVRRRLEILA
jgi:hypothetical protein